MKGNPYRWNQINLDLVFGRDLLVDEMVEELLSPSGMSFGLAGARRIGKTTVLRLVEAELKEAAQELEETGTSLVVIYLDGLVFPRPLASANIWSQVLNSLSHSFATDCLVDDALNFSDFLTCVSNIIEKSERLPRIVILIDEIEHIVACDWADGLFANFRALLSNTPGVSRCISAVFSGAREMIRLQNDIGSPLGDVLEWRNLSCLSFGDTLKLMQAPLDIKVRDEVASYVFEETGGHPMVVQYIMQRALKGADLLEMENVVACVDEFEKKRHWQLDDWWTKYCDENGRRIYASLPQSMEMIPVAPFASEFGGHNLAEAMEILQHVGIINVSEDNGLIGRRGRIFSRWQATAASLPSSNSVDETLGLMLKELSGEFRDKYVSAWGIYNSEIPNYSGAVSEMRDIITLVLHKLAPNELVTAQSGFQFERGQTTPTRRQRVMYIFGSQREQGKAVAGDDELLEMNASKLASLIGKAYANASSLTHTTSSRELAYTSLKQGESVLAQIIPVGLVGGSTDASQEYE